MNSYALKVAGSIQQKQTRGKWITKYISFVNVKFLKELKKELATRAISAGHLASYSQYKDKQCNDVILLLCIIMH